eukprot:jgi/Hompol1/7084/HPOL_002437-RA
MSKAETTQAKPKLGGSPFYKFQAIAGPTRRMLQRTAHLTYIIFASGPDSVFLPYILLVGSNAVYQYYVNDVFVQISAFYTVLGNKDVGGFNATVNHCLWLFCIISLFLALNHFFSGWFSVRARRSLTKTLQSRYITNANLYQLAVARHDLDNPDQRITQDISNFVDTIRSILESLVIVPGLIGWYSKKLTDIDNTATSPLIFYGFFLGSIIICRIAIHPVISLVFNREYAEGNFRYLHVRARTNAEGIAFMAGAPHELGKLSKTLETVLSWQFAAIAVEFVVKFITTYIDYLGSIISYIAVSVPIFKGNYDGLIASDPYALSSVISLNTSITLYLVNQFTVITDTAESVATLYGYTSRLGQFLESVEQIEKVKAVRVAKAPKLSVGANGQSGAGSSAVVSSEGSKSIEIRDLTFYSPGGNPIMSHLNLTINPNEHLLIMGPSGCGKSSFLRILAGLWNPEVTNAGAIIFPAPSVATSLFVPQVPYFVCGGSLRDQIAYPFDVSVSDEDLRRVLRDAEIEYLLDRELDGTLYPNQETRVNKELTLALSVGEQERLALARILYHRPTYAFFDEPTANLPKDVAVRIFDKMFASGITCIVISHEIVPGFNRRLVLQSPSEGIWELVQV